MAGLIFKEYATVHIYTYLYYSMLVRFDSQAYLMVQLPYRMKGTEHSNIAIETCRHIIQIVLFVSMSQ